MKSRIRAETPGPYHLAVSRYQVVDRPITVASIYVRMTTLLVQVVTTMSTADEAAPFRHPLMN